MHQVDLNCDLGEGDVHDRDLMAIISSANIACGAHAGNEETMRATIGLALQHGVAVGAHPGLADRQNFGRVERPVTAGEIRDLVLTQTEKLQALAEKMGACVKHVKPHGALYNMAARDADLAAAVAGAVYEADSRLTLVGLAGSPLVDAGRRAGLRVMQEVFADRTYRADGRLTPRNQPDAVIRNTDAAVTQVLRMVRDGRVNATDGTEVEIRAETICLHGDGDRAVEFARTIADALKAAGVEIRRPGG